VRVEPGNDLLSALREEHYRALAMPDNEGSSLELVAILGPNDFNFIQLDVNADAQEVAESLRQLDASERHLLTSVPDPAGTRTAPAYIVRDSDLGELRSLVDRPWPRRL